MKKLKRAICFVLTFLLLFSGATAFIEIQQVEASSKVKLSATKKTINRGSSFTLSIKGVKSVKWSTSNKKVASIKKVSNTKYKVTGIKAGTSKITAKVGNKKYTCRVTVENPKINKKSLSLQVGASSTLKITGTKAKIKWKTSNKSVATVSNKGKVTAKKAGTATISAKINGKNISCKVTVPKPTTKPTATPRPTAIPTATATPRPTATPTPTPKPVDKTYTIDMGDGKTETVVGHFDYAAAVEIVRLVNVERAKVKLPALVVNSELTAMAEVRGSELVALFSHTRPNGTQWSTLSNKANGENIAGISWGGTASQAMTNWMNSPGHKENILRNTFKSIGVACFNEKTASGRYANHYVQIFGMNP